MSFDNKTYPNRKDRLKPYYGSKRFDRTCRNHGSCPYCRNNRLFQTMRVNRLKNEIDEGVAEFTNKVIELDR